MGAKIVIDGVVYGSSHYGAPDYNVDQGGLVMVEYVGRNFIANKLDLRWVQGWLDCYGAKVIELTDETIPKFLHEQRLVVSRSLHCSINIYPLNKEDIAPLGVALSKDFKRCVYEVSSRFLTRWEDGLLKGNFKLSDFYDNISEEEDKRVSLNLA